MCHIISGDDSIVATTGQTLSKEPFKSVFINFASTEKSELESIEIQINFH